MALINVLLVLMAITSMFGMVIGTNYTVGQPGGTWDTSTNFTKWVSDKTFHVGDNLLFSYVTPHDVWEVTAGDYATCAKGSPLKEYSGGNTLIPLKEIGFRYFICSFGSHCASGQKVAISVVLSNPSNSPSVTPPPPAPPSPTGVAPAMNVGTCAMVVVALVAMLLVVV